MLTRRILFLVFAYWLSIFQSTQGQKVLTPDQNSPFVCWSSAVELFRDHRCGVNGQTIFSQAANIKPRSAQHGPIAKHGPWSHAPVCFAGLTSDDELLCVYTSSVFNNGRGISLVTTPQIANLLARQTEFSSVGSDTPLSRISRRGVTQHTTSQSKSIRATQPIQQGQLVMVNKAVLLVHPSYWNISWPQREEITRLAISRLPGGTQKAILNLSSPPDQINLYLSYIVWAHAGFPMVIRDQKHNVLFTGISLINHSCAPNSHNRVESISFSGVVTAARDIQEGEEITISYWVDSDHSMHLRSFVERQQYIERNGRFRCECAYCEQGKAKDEILGSLLDQQKSLQQKLESSSIAGSDLPAAFKLEKLYHSLGLEILMNVPYNIIAKTYSAMGREKLASVWLERAANILALSGVETPQQQHGVDAS